MKAIIGINHTDMRRFLGTVFTDVLLGFLVLVLCEFEISGFGCCGVL
jgi:hypothetical protein